LRFEFQSAIDVLANAISHSCFQYDPNCLQMQRQMLGVQQQNGGRSNTTSMMQKQQYDGNEIITMTRQELEKLIQVTYSNSWRDTFSDWATAQLPP
jgi:hypothetical protein